MCVLPCPHVLLCVAVLLAGVEAEDDEDDPLLRVDLDLSLNAYLNAMEHYQSRKR